MKTRLTITLAILAILACMAPTCAGSDQGAGAGVAEEPVMLLCAADGTPIDIGVPGAGWAMWECAVTYKSFLESCDCWREAGPVVLALPGGEEGAIRCVEIAAAAQAGFTLNETGIAQGVCHFIGNYVKPTPGPNAAKRTNNAG